MAGEGRVDEGAFYGEWAGHRPGDLAGGLRGCCGEGGGEGRRRRVLWLLGDSSLDNKFWLRFCPPPRRAQPCNGYERALRPGHLMHRDVCYWLNRAALRAPGLDLVTINAAVEASTLGERSGSCGGPRLLPQDLFAAAHMLPGDVLCVSVGGNDVAMRPTMLTTLAMLTLSRASPDSVTSGRAWGLRYLVRLFRDGLRTYLGHVLGDCPVAAVLVCCVYYPSLGGGGTSWADPALRVLGYDHDPTRLQSVLREIFERAVSDVRVPGIPVVPVPLFEFLDPGCPADYVARVEPSVVGGRKLAEGILAQLRPLLPMPTTTTAACGE